MHEQFTLRIDDDTAALVAFPLTLPRDQRAAFMARPPAKAVADAVRVPQNWRAIDAQVAAMRKAGDDAQVTPRYIAGPSPFDALYEEPAAADTPAEAPTPDADHAFTADEE